MQPPPTSTPNPTAPPRRPPNPRPLLGAVLAAVGTVALLVGIVAVASPRGLSATPSPGPSGSATAGGGSSPSAPASPSGSPAAVTPLPSTADPVLAGAGDIGRCGSAEPALTAGILAGTPGQLFTLGDNAYDHGTAADFANCFDPTWGKVRDRIAFPVPGNHDWETDKAAGYLGYFGTAAAPQGTTWYSRDLGAWHVIVLDATCAKVGGCGEGSPQLAWLRDDLARDTARCTLALWHQPRFSSGEHGDDATVGPFWEALYAAGADLVLNGHDHDYERFAPQDPAGRADPARGLTEIVVGTGGTSLREFATLAANSVVRNSFAHGVLVLTLHATSWDYRFVSTDGSFSDQGHGACH